MVKNIFSVGLAILMTSACLAQEQDGQIDPNSLLRIPKYEQLYKHKIWRSIDLREKQNKGFFARGNEISELIVDAVKSGEIADVYLEDSLTAKMSKEDFMSGLVSQLGQTLAPWDPTTDFYTGDLVTYSGKNYQALADSKGKNPGTSKDDWQGTSAGSAQLFLPIQI